MEKTRNRALELANIIVLNEVPPPKEVDEARQELTDLLKKLDAQTLKEIMERIRGFS